MKNSQRPFVLAESDWKTIREGSYQVAILPWGATEPHNFHLPYATDVYESTFVSERAAEIAWSLGARVIVLPTIPFGANTGQLDLTLTINVNPSTQLAMLSDIASSLAGQGIKKLVIINGHGGNDFRMDDSRAPTAHRHLHLDDQLVVVRGSGAVLR